MPSYPLTLPTTVKPSAVDLRLRRTTSMTESPFTYAQQVHEHQGARWEMEISFPPMTRAQAYEMQAFINSLRGRRGTFLAEADPLAATNLGGGSNGTLNGAASARATSIATSGVGALIAGDFIQIGTGSDAHLHQVVTGGTNTFEIEPALRSDYIDGTTVTVNAPKGLWRLSSDDIGWNIAVSSLYGFTIPCIEAI